MIEFRAAGYIEVWRDGVLLSRHRAEREAIESCDANGPGNYEVRFPTVFVVIRPPITRPTTPELGTPTALSDTSLSVPLTRQAGGPVQIAEYVLERTTTATWTEIARGSAIFGTGNAYTDTGLTSSTVYQYRCKAIDTTGRESDYCAPVSATTDAAGGDTTPPSTPTNLVVAQDGAALTLTWTASTDDFAVQDYDILRGLGDGNGSDVAGSSSIIATTVATNYSDATVTAGQEYYYRVRARDTSLNTGDYTARVFATAATGAQTYLFQDGFEGEGLGAAGATASWGTNLNGGTITIANATPLGAGQGKYFTGECIKAADGTVYRSERRLLNATNTRPSYGGATALGYDMWYGFRWRPDALVGGEGGYPMQFHDDPGGDNTNPCVALVYNGTTLQMIASKAYTDAGALGNNWYGTIGAVAVGTVVDIVLRIRWCYRSNAQGGNGAVDIYIDDETTPRLAYRGSTAHAPPYTSGQVPYFRCGGYWSAFRFNLANGGGVWKATNSFDQVRVQGQGGSRIGVKPQGAR